MHRAMDTVGAFIGPVVAFALMRLLSTDRGTAYDAVFVVSFCIAVVGVAALLLLVRDPFRATRARPDGVSVRAGLRLTLRPVLGRPSLAALLLGLATVSDSFVYLSLQQRTDLAIGWFPLLPLGTTGVFLLSAVPLGALADRIGRRRILIAGHLLLALAYLLLTGAVPLGGRGLIITVLALHGLFYGATDGVLMAHAGPLLPERLRTSGLSVLQTSQAFGRSVSSVAFGAVWAACGPVTAVRGFLVALLVAVAAAALLLGVRRKAAATDPVAGPWA
ncbi:MFS transporter [Streptacidiphilus monticola]